MAQTGQSPPSREFDLIEFPGCFQIFPDPNIRMQRDADARIVRQQDEAHNTVGLVFGPQLCFGAGPDE